MGELLVVKVIRTVESSVGESSMTKYSTSFTKLLFF